MAIHPSKRSPQCTQFPHLHLPTAPGKDKQETRSLSLALVTGQGGTARSPSQDTQAWQGTRLGPELEWRLCPCLGPWGREPTWPEWPPDPPWLGMAHKACRNPVRAAAPSGLWPQMNLFRVFPTTCSSFVPGHSPSNLLINALRNGDSMAPSLRFFGYLKRHSGSSFSWMFRLGFSFDLNL